MFLRNILFALMNNFYVPVTKYLGISFTQLHLIFRQLFQSITAIHITFILSTLAFFYCNCRMICHRVNISFILLPALTEFRMCWTKFNKSCICLCIDKYIPSSCFYLVEILFKESLHFFISYLKGEGNICVVVIYLFS